MPEQGAPTPQVGGKYYGQGAALLRSEQVPKPSVDSSGVPEMSPVVSSALIRYAKPAPGTGCSVAVGMSVTRHL